jgi:hypothetical protein
LSVVCECIAELMNHSNCLFYILILKVRGLDSGYTIINRTCYNDTSKRSVEKIDVYLYLRTRKTLHITLNHFKFFQVFDDSFLTIEL